MVRPASWILVLAMAPLLAGVSPAHAQDRNWTLCTGDSDNDGVIIRSCNAVIQAGKQTNENLAIAFKNLCLAYNNQGDHDRAINNCDQALRLKPAYLDAYRNRGHAYFNKGDNDRAIADYDQVLALGPNETALVQRGAAYHMKGDNVRAIADLDQAVALDPDDAIAFYVRGASYEKQNDNGHALQDYSQAIRLAPKFAASIFRRGVLEKQMGDAKGGDADIALARKIDPTVGK